jgi:hypothetical protein
MGQIDFQSSPAPMMTLGGGMSNFGMPGMGGMTGHMPMMGGFGGQRLVY